MFTEAELQKKSKDEIVALVMRQLKAIDYLQEQFKLYQHRQFAKRSEQYNEDNPQQNLFDEAQANTDSASIEQADEEITVAAHKRKPGRKPLPKDLLREQQVHDLTAQEKICSCGCTQTHIGDERSEQLNIIPAKVYVIENIYKKYACKSCEQTITQAIAPKQPIPKSIAAPLRVPRC